MFLIKYSILTLVVKLSNESENNKSNVVKAMKMKIKKTKRIHLIPIVII